MSDMTPDEMARACADSMWANDEASQSLGMKIEDISAGRAVLSMPVRADMLNGQRICHGGYMFLLADSAFAFACNGYNQFTVAQACKIDFLAPAFEGDVLDAVAQERYREGRSGIYDCTVTNQDGKVIAEMRGNSRTVKGQHLPDKEGA
ncbi:MAG: hydroxyphenylacetyl-CoA thioesterase PaaI [Rhizobiaceae bacterium]|nr:hydroxyphenylacetyl-CoA thioesterase PaaI [Rhizobiaceae bacterium]